MAVFHDHMYVVGLHNQAIDFGNVWVVDKHLQFECLYEFGEVGGGFFAADGAEGKDGTRCFVQYEFDGGFSSLAQELPYLKII